MKWRALVSLTLTFLMVFPLSPTTQIKSHQSNDVLSPATGITETGFTEAQRRALLESIVERADAERQNVDINIFQGYDVRGDALEHDGKEANLEPEDAFLIAEAIAYTYKLRDETQPRILITGDHRETSQALITAAAAGAYHQGFDQTL